MCSGNWDYDHLPAPYPALNTSEIAAFCDGEAAVVLAAQKWLIANGGYDYNCFTFITSNHDLPIASDTADICATKLIHLDHKASKSAMVLYSDRVNNAVYNDSNIKEAIAIFMLTRADYWYFGYPASNILNITTATYLLSDYGVPLTNMTRPDPSNYIFQRKYEKVVVQFDCSSFTATFINNDERIEES